MKIYLFVLALITLWVVFTTHVQGKASLEDEEDEFFDEEGEFEDYDVGVFGDAILPKSAPAPNIELSTQFANTFPDRAINLYWVDPNGGEDIIIADIEAASTAGINTFEGHVFYAETIEDFPVRAVPDSIVVSSRVTSYTFGPDEDSVAAPKAPPKYASSRSSSARSSSARSSSARSSSSKSAKPKTKPAPDLDDYEIDENATKLHPAIQLLNVRSTSVNVKFRSLAPAIDMWYDGGPGNEVFQGSLSLGQESTINTYEGHVFYFTEKDNKKRELARQVINADEVERYRAIL